VVRAGDKYYLVNSSFAPLAGIPIHESTDLVHWTLVGHALGDPTKVSFDGLNISRGVFAPSIHFTTGTFYVINTLVDAGGNFFVTATNPRGPWSDPVWLKGIDGIDPSFFFDDDGKAYILNNGPPEGAPLYDGHRAIWMQEFDLGGRKPWAAQGDRERRRRSREAPIWIEGPHLYRIKEWYYLMCAEGGTGPGHSEVIFRSKSPWGPYEPGKTTPSSRNATCLPVARTRSPMPGTPIWCRCRTAAGGRCSSPRALPRLSIQHRARDLVAAGELEDGWPMILEPASRFPTS
jgi:alpha-N-arabinofuranosidase